MWIGVTTAIVVDLAPSRIRTAAVAFYLFIITIIGGNANLLVSPLHNGFKNQFSDLRSYQWALLLMYPGVFAISSFLFVLAFLFMSLDLKRKARLDHTVLVNDSSSPNEGSLTLEDDDEPQDKPV